MAVAQRSDLRPLVTSNQRERVDPIAGMREAGVQLETGAVATNLFVAEHRVEHR
ncbi:hypothetical protein [Methylibium sp.]|uniref:hypothetical protein n=1 Tax=Methylibium sp. TaxID=2067992 RepID=UPI003D13BF3F